MKWQIRGMREAVAEKFPLFPLSPPAPAQPTSTNQPFSLMSTILEDSISFRYHSWMNCGSFELHMIFSQLVQTQLCWTPKTRKKTFPNKSRHWVLFTSSIPIFPQDVLVYFSFHTPKQLIDNVQRLFFLASSCFFSLPLAPQSIIRSVAILCVFVVFIFLFSPPPSPSSWGPAINWSQCGLWWEIRWWLPPTLPPNQIWPEIFVNSEFDTKSFDK